MSLTYEQALALRNKHQAHVIAYDKHVNYLVRTIVLEDDKELRDDLYKCLVRLVGSVTTAQEYVADYHEQLNDSWVY